MKLWCEKLLLGKFYMLICLQAFIFKTLHQHNRKFSPFNCFRYVPSAVCSIIYDVFNKDKMNNLTILRIVLEIFCTQLYVSRWGHHLSCWVSYLILIWKPIRRSKNLRFYPQCRFEAIFGDLIFWSGQKKIGNTKSNSRLTGETWQI